LSKEIKSQERGIAKVRKKGVAATVENNTIGALCVANEIRIVNV
jgi:hypothetical protein